MSCLSSTLSNNDDEITRHQVNKGFKALRREEDEANFVDDMKTKLNEEQSTIVHSSMAYTVSSVNHEFDTIEKALTL